MTFLPAFNARFAVPPALAASGYCPGPSGARSGTGMHLRLRSYGGRRQHRRWLRDRAAAARRPVRTGAREGPRRRRALPGRVLAGLRARPGRGYEPRPAGSWAAPGAKTTRAFRPRGADIFTEQRRMVIWKDRPFRRLALPGPNPHSERHQHTKTPASHLHGQRGREGHVHEPGQGAYYFLPGTGRVACRVCAESRMARGGCQGQFSARGAFAQIRYPLPR